MTTATAEASPNIAFIKYWGNRDNHLRLPMNGSISMNMDSLFTRTTVSFQPSLPYDELIINGHEVTGQGAHLLHPRSNPGHGGSSPICRGDE
jgi:diphosphomevalonate decarboxylase